MNTDGSVAKGERMAVWPITGSTQSTRLTLSTSTAACDKLVAGGEYKVSLGSLSGGSAFCVFAATATAPATNAAVANGFWLNPGEAEIVSAPSATLAAILLSGTGELFITRLR